MSEQQAVPRSRKWRLAFEVSATLLMLVIGGLLVWQRWAATPRVARPTTRPPSELVAIGAAPTKGSGAASVVMIEYTDFECPFCAKIATGPMKLLQEKYVSSGRVMLVFKHFPLPIHKLAPGASVAASCAGAQGKFWEMHDILFEHERLVASDKADGEGLGVVVTPTFFVGLRQPGNRVKVTDVLVGSRNVSEFSEVFDRLLSKSAQ